MMKIQYLRPRILYLFSKASFRVEGHIKSFSDKNKLKEFINTRPVLQELLEGLFKEEHVSKTGINNGNNYIHINKYLKWKRIKCSNQKIEWLNE